MGWRSGPSDLYPVEFLTVAPSSHRAEHVACAPWLCSVAWVSKI
jgi:hypothetical protein